MPEVKKKLNPGPNLFVCLDANQNAILFRKFADGYWWAYIWNSRTKTFVTSRTVDSKTVEDWRQRQLTESQQQLYLDLVK